MKQILALIFGIAVGVGGSALMYQQKTPVAVGSAEGCIHDGYIVHADGSKTVNWVCYDPNQLL